MIFKISLNYLFNKSGNHYSRFINILIILGILIGSISLISTLTITDSILGFQKTNIINQNPYIIITSRSVLNNKTNPLPFSNNPNIESIHYINKMQMLLSSEGNLIPLEIEGEDSFKSKNIYSIILNTSIEERYNFKVGETINLTLIGQPFYSLFGPIFIKHNFQIIGFQNLSTDGIIPLKASNKLLYQKTNSFLSYKVLLKNPLASSNLLTPSLKNKFQISSPISRNYQFLGAISTEKHIMLIMISFIILISCINIIVSLSISIFSKKKEVAILRTLGLTKFRISLIFMLQILILTIFSLVLSNIISFIIIDKTNLLNNILDIPGDFILKLNYGSIILVDISTILITFLAALYPSIKANQINIIKNL